MAITRNEEKQKDQVEEVVISRVVESETLQYEANQIVVKAWSFFQMADRSSAAFSDTMSVLISSHNDYILLTMFKERGDHYRLKIENVKNHPEKIPDAKPLYTYSFYTLDPKKLVEYFDKINQGGVEKLSELNPTKLLLMQAWEFLKACGMDRLVVITDNISRAHMSLYRNPNTPRRVATSCFSSLETFGANNSENYEQACCCYGMNEYGPPYNSLLGNAKLLESKQIDLRVRDENRVHYSLYSDVCNIL